MEKQVVLHLINEKGEKVTICPTTTGYDVKIGSLLAGELKLPGSTQEETLIMTLRNIRRYLENLEGIADVKRVVSDVLEGAGTKDIPSMKAVDELLEKFHDMQLTISSIVTAIDSLAPINHAAPDETYGLGTTENFGHVKLLTKLEDNTDEDGIALAPSIGVQLQSQINEKANISHTSIDGSNGIATGTTYGHVKLIDTYDTEVEGSGLVSTANSVKRLYDNLGPRVTDLEIKLPTKADLNHAATEVASIGGGTNSMYGHVSLTDDYTTNSGGAINSVAASSEAVYNCYTALHKEVIDMGGVSVVNLNTCDDKSFYYIMRYLIANMDSITNDTKFQDIFNCDFYITNVSTLFDRIYQLDPNAFDVDMDVCQTKYEIIENDSNILGSVGYYAKPLTPTTYIPKPRWDMSVKALGNDYIVLAKDITYFNHDATYKTTILDMKSGPYYESPAAIVSTDSNFTASDAICTVYPKASTGYIELYLSTPAWDNGSGEYGYSWYSDIACTNEKGHGAVSGQSSSNGVVITHAYRYNLKFKGYGISKRRLLTILTRRIHDLTN